MYVCQTEHDDWAIGLLGVRIAQEMRPVVYIDVDY